MPVAEPSSEVRGPAVTCVDRRRATMINGAHSVIYSTNPEADRAFLRDVLGLPNVDVGDG
jgi:hypothetical protein